MSATSARVMVVGGGPGGLMAAEQLATEGCAVTVVEHMPSVGRKFLLAGRSGLNLTHSEPTPDLMARYGDSSARLAPAIAAFDAAALRAWAAGLGERTFVGTSGRVFPESFRATPLLRSWLARLDGLGVTIRTGVRWTGFTEVDAGVGVRLVDHGVEETASADAVVLALGGASWPKVGSDGGWVEILSAAGVTVSDLRPANCGFTAEWTPTFVGRFTGAPLKNVALTFGGRTVRGEGVVTESGVESGVFYALGAAIRDAIEADGRAMVHLDLHPDVDIGGVVSRLARRRSKESWSTTLRRAGLAPVAVSLLREVTGNRLPADIGELAALVKAVPLTLVGTESLARSISTAGGVAWDEVDERFMLRRMPGVFVVGEMLDWEAPTGGYLLQATFSTAVAAALGVVSWVDESDL